MSSSAGRGGSKTKIKIPKVRRNSGEVRAYNDLSRPARKSDQLLLWATALGLFSLALIGGLQIWRMGQQPESQPRLGTELATLRPADVLRDARQLYIQGQMPEAGLQAHLALSLELATPSRPPLEKDIRRLLGLVSLQEKDYSAAIDQLRWLNRHQPSPDDRANLTFSRQQLERAWTNAALDQLEGAQVLLTQGHEQRALAEARQALRALEGRHTDPRSLQAGHLIVANIALQQGNAGLALLELREAEKRGGLGPQHRALLNQLIHWNGQTLPSHPSALAMTGMQVKVVIPRLETQAAYPLGRTSARAPRPASSAVPEPPAEMAPPQAALAPGRAEPKVELPRLELPGQGGLPGSLPSYQDQSGNALPSYRDQSGQSLPGYSAKSRPRDSLPGY